MSNDLVQCDDCDEYFEEDEIDDGACGWCWDVVGA